MTGKLVSYGLLLFASELKPPFAFCRVASQTPAAGNAAGATRAFPHAASARMTSAVIYEMAVLSRPDAPAAIDILRCGKEAQRGGRTEIVEAIGSGETDLRGVSPGTRAQVLSR